MSFSLPQLRRRIYTGLTSLQVVLPLIVFFGVVGIGVAMMFTNGYTLVIPPALISGVVIFKLANQSKYQNVESSADYRLFLSITLMLFSIMFLWYAFEGYQRSIWIHFLTSALYLTVGVGIWYLDRVSVPLGVTIFLALTQRVLTYFASVIPMGRDSYFHVRMAREVASTGSLEPLADAGSKYFFAPVFHLLVGESIIITEAPSRIVTVGSTLLISTVVPLCIIYLFTKQVWSKKTAATGVLLYSASDYAIRWAVLPRTETITVALFSICLYFLYRYMIDDSVRIFVLFTIYLITLSMTHQVSFFITTVCIIGFCFIYLLRRPYRTANAVRVVVLTGSVLTSSWLFTLYSGPGSAPFIAQLVLILYTKLNQSGVRSAVFPQSDSFVVGGADTLGISQTLGTGILFAVAVVGALVWLSRTEAEQKFLGVTMGIIVGVLSGFVFVAPLFGLDLLLPYRWFAFLYVPLAVLGAVGVATITKRASSIKSTDAHRSLAVLLVISSLIIPYAFVSGGNYAGAPDNPVITSPGAQRLSTTQPEAQAYEHVTMYQGSAIVVSDFAAFQILLRYYGANVKTYRYKFSSSHIGEEVVFNTDRLLLYRSYSGTERAGYYVKFDERWWPVFGPIEKPQGDKVYSSKDISVIYRNET